MTKEERGLLDDLAAIGFDVNSAWDLFGKRLDYKSAIPVLMKWLPEISDPKIKEGVVRALSVKWAKPVAGPLLISEFEKVRDADVYGVGWVIGNAIEVVADDSMFDEIVRLLSDPEYGDSRTMLALAMGKMKDPRADDVIVRLLDEGEFIGVALEAAGKRRTQQARPDIEKYLTHDDAWIRNKARVALKRLDAKASMKRDSTVRGMPVPSPRAVEEQRIIKEIRGEADATKSNPFAWIKRTAKNAMQRLETKTSKGSAPTRQLTTASETGNVILTETSTNFDAELVREFLERLATIVGGFGSDQIAQVEDIVDELEVDYEAALSFEVVHQEQVVPLNILIFMDDIDSPDLFFTAPESLTDEITKLIEVFVDEHDM